MYATSIYDSGQQMAVLVTKSTALSRLLCLLLLSIFLSGCTLGLGASAPATPVAKKQTFTSAATNQTITYSTGPRDVILRTFYGGSLAGTLQLGPRISIYGDGSYTLGLERRGQLNSADLQKLLSTLVGTDGLLTLTQQQFFDLPDEDATYLELKLNGKTRELVYGIFGSQPESQQVMTEYQHLGNALQTLNEALSGPTQPYASQDYALFARQVSFVDNTQVIPYWPLTDFTLDQLSTFECGVVPEDTTSTNKEIGCLKYTIPQHALLLSPAQYAALKPQLPLDQPEDFRENGLYYEITMRPLLPDEKQLQTLAMFGGSQITFTGVPLQNGPIPQNTPTA
jgi:hypothetical protein